MSAVIEQVEILVDEWLGCYRGGWKGVIVDGAFVHPAKAAFNLAKRIYEHAIGEGWIVAGNVVCDPFGGIGGCAFHGLMNGMRVVTCELEEKFVNLSKENRELWREQYTGLPGFNADNWIILQGDSRTLASVISEARIAVSSPPYAVVSPEKSSKSVDYEKQYATYRLQGGGASFEKFVATQELHSQGYGSSDGQLANLPATGHALAVSSPPYIESLKPETEDQTRAKQERIAKSKQMYDGRARTVGVPGDAGLGGGYGTTEGNLGAMPAGDLCVSSPPFPQPYTGGSVGQIGKETGDTFWSASRTILEQLYSVLTPGAHAIFIVKAFVRNKQIVNFPDQWAQLCEAVGFKLIHDHHAMLTEDSGTQGGMFGEDKQIKVKRVSFFRRLHEKRSPETAIDYENVLCFERL